MKKGLKFTALLLAATIMFSSCIGSFQLTSKFKKVNESIGSKWVNELVFAACWLFPIYEICVLADILVLNSIEFWSGKKMLANKGEKKIVKNTNKFRK